LLDGFGIFSPSFPFKKIFSAMDKQSHLGRTILKLYLFDVKKKMGAEKNGGCPECVANFSFISSVALIFSFCPNFWLKRKGSVSFS